MAGRDPDTEPELHRVETAATIPGSPRARRPTEPELQPGTAVGRYLLIGPIGEGGMGVVYAAYDPKLDRKVALKFVREAESPHGQTRLLREAHAMAKLSHPNVLPIYDVGTYGERVFLAIELVDGATLEEWLETPRSVREVLAAFLGAARGLAAAHSAELVHRDFKPSNVLVGKDDRVRVTDFGLARADRDTEGEPGASRSLLDEQLTVDGSVMGTPAYMAPEQRRAVSADDRSDQFSFCVALYEALYGESPFAGEGEARWAAIEASQVREPRKGSAVPAYVRQAVLRGLAVDPAARHPSMDALIAALRVDPAAAQRRLVLRLGIAVLGVCALIAVAWWMRRDPAVAPCRGSDTLLAGVWDDRVRGQLAARFATLDKPFAVDAWTRTQAVIDDYATRWTGLRQEVCEATRLRAEQSEAAMVLRMTCLDRRLDRLRALSKALGTADADAVLRAVDAARSLERLEDCSDLQALEQRTPPPEGARALQVAALRDKLTELQVLFDLGKYQAGQAAIAQLVATATSLGYRPLEAEIRELHAMYLRRDARPEEVPALLDAFHAAEAARDDRRKARLALRLAHASSFITMDFKRATEWLDQGAAILEALGGDPELEGLLLHERGNVLIRQGRYADSLAWYRKALAIRTSLSNGEWAAMETLHNIGIAEKESGSLERALQAMEDSTKIVERLVGSSHPELVKELQNLSWVQLSAHRTPEALATSQRALRLATQVFGPDHPRTGEAMLYAASALNVDSQFGEGGRLAHRATVLILDAERRLDAHTVEGKALGGLGKHREALATMQAGLARAEPELGRDNPALSRVLVEIANQLEKLEDYAAAIPPLERAGAMRKAMTAIARAEVDYLLGIALWGSNRDRVRGLALVRQVREVFAAEPHHEEDVAEIDAWIAGHASR